MMRYTTDEWQEENIRIHQDNGSKTLEEDGMKRTDQKQRDFKCKADPKKNLLAVDAA